MTSGVKFIPNWYYRNSLGRKYFSQDICTITGPMIGFKCNLLGDGTLATDKPLVISAAAAATITDGKYINSGPSKGYNTPPVYNYSQVVGSGPDSWEMYSYGYSASVNFVGNAEMMDSQFGIATYDAASYHNGSSDFAANKVYYATTVGQASSFGRAYAHIQLVNLPYVNVYFENTLYAVYTMGWAGYAKIPTYGPDTAGGIDYTALNVHNTCFQLGSTPTCPNGGMLNLGLGDYIDPTGLNPMFAGLTVYDNDIWSNIYDYPLGTPPTGYQKPETFMNWMTTKYTAFTCKSSGTFVATTASCLAKVTKNKLLTAATPGIFNFQAHQDVALPLASATVYTFNFKPNIYFSDHVQMTAYDYNFSLWAGGVVANASLPFLTTPFYALAAGQLGLQTTYINPAHPLTIYVIMNSTTVWNLGSTQVPIIPQHIFEKYFNLQSIFSAELSIDTSQPYAIANAYSNFTTGALTAPHWLLNLPNLEQGTGPFMLRTNDEVTNTGELIRNLNYYRNYWQTYTINASQSVHKGTPYALDMPITEWSYNTTLFTGDHIGQVPMTQVNLQGGSIVGWAAVVNPAGHALVGENISLVFNIATGHVTANIPTSTISVGAHELIIKASYTYLGLPRTYYEQYGFKVLHA